MEEEVSMDKATDPVHADIIAPIATKGRLTKASQSHVLIANEIPSPVIPPSMEPAVSREAMPASEIVTSMMKITDNKKK